MKIKVNSVIRLCILMLAALPVVILSGCSAVEKEHTQNVNFVDYGLADCPRFVDSIEDCTSEFRKYVLPDGMLYEYLTEKVYSAVNQIPLSVDENGKVYNDVGYLDNARIRSTLEIVEAENSFVTGFIPVKTGDIIYFLSNCFDPDHAEAGSFNIGFYDINKQAISQVAMLTSCEQFFSVISESEDGYVTSMQINDIGRLEKLAFVRFTLIGSGYGHQLSLNEDFLDYVEESRWSPTSAYVTTDWYDEVKVTSSAVNSIKLQDDSVIRFLFSSDIHLEPGAGSESYTQNIGKVSAAVMQMCDIPFFVNAGDSCTQSSWFMPSDFKANMEEVLLQMEPVPQQNMLFTVGNHDGATGQKEVDGETLHYRFQLDNQERSSVFFDWQKNSNEQKVFGEDGSYYYLDDPDTKTRYIALNSFWAPWEGDSEGFVTDIEHSFFHNPRFGEEQLLWLANEALNLPSGYAAVINTHNVFAALDYEFFKGIVDAFENKTSFSGSYVGDEQWQSVAIDVDFKKSKGELIAVFQGHEHKDIVYHDKLEIPVITITTAGAARDVRDIDALERVKDSASETAVDVVSIDRNERKIYMTRLGAGEDRVIDY